MAPPKKKKTKKKKAVSAKAKIKKYPALTALKTAKQKKFVIEVAKGAPGTEALRPAGYNPKDQNSAQTMSGKLLKRNDIQMALSEVILNSYPDTQKKISQVMDAMLDMARQEVSCPHCGGQLEVKMPALKPSEITNLIKMYAEICGWKAPSKSMSLTAKVDTAKYQLPEE